MSDLNLQFARGGAEFTVGLFEKLKAASGQENIIISPFSIQTCLALAFAGAKGDTADELATALKYVSNSKTEVAETFQYVLDQYKDSELLKIANKVYVKEDRQIKAEYAAMTKENYHAGAESINFSENEAAAKTINSWVETKTAGKIKDLIPATALGVGTRLVLLNALHFKGEWERKFDEANTVEDDFWVTAEQSVKVKYMKQKAHLSHGYFHQYKCSALEMAYKDSDLSMFVLLPEERDGLQALAEHLKDVNLIDLSEQMCNEELIVKFPKFKIDYAIEMSEVLQEMGLHRAFTEVADFGDMLDPAENMCISQVFHKACIEVNEEGTEAAAATGAIMMSRCLMQFEFNADRPFFYWIWNKKNILFAGAFVNAPKEA